MKITDYMSRPEEQAKQPEALALVQRIAHFAPAENRTAVFNALWSFWNFAHIFDDLMDESGWDEQRKELAWRGLQEFTSDLLLNPMYRAHGAEVRAMFTSAIFRQIAGDKMATHGDPSQSRLAPAVRCADIDCLVHFAYLVGGWELAHEISNAREYDKEDKTDV